MMQPSLRQWLASDAPASRRQAVLGNLYRGVAALCANPAALAGLVIVGALIFVAIFAPMIAGYVSPIQQTLAERLAPPSSTHWFGTDELGRDIYARTVHGSRVTLTIVMLVSVVVAPIGLAVGTTAGYLGGWADAVLMRITDIFLAFPRLVLALAFAAALGPGIENAVIAISLTAWPPYARIARAETVTIARSDFIAAVVLQGASTSENPVSPHCAALPVLVDRAPHARHGRDYPHGGGPWFSRPRRPAANGGVGRDGLLGA